MIGLPLLALNVMLDQVKSGKSFVIEPHDVIYEYKKEFTLEALYETLQCEMIEVVNLKDDLIFICDEEGMFKESVVNMIATRMYQDAYDTTEVGIIGRCIICQSSQLR